MWDHNRFAASRPAIERVVESPYVRGAVTGIGVVTAIAGLAELASVVSRRRPRADSTHVES
ncbi:MAG: hypothetical protein HOQ29_17810 [Acidobacteria bacterium]|nr:hypothetical protein [Acidobacteriota bacterium]